MLEFRNLLNVLLSRLESKPSGWVGSRTLVDYLLKISKIEYRKEPEALLGCKGGC